MNERMNMYLSFVMVLFIPLAFHEMQIFFLIQLNSFLNDQHGLLSFIPQHVQPSEQPFFFSVELNLSLNNQYLNH